MLSAITMNLPQEIFDMKLHLAVTPTVSVSSLGGCQSAMTTLSTFFFPLIVYTQQVGNWVCRLCLCNVHKKGYNRTYYEKGEIFIQILQALYNSYNRNGECALSVPKDLFRKSELMHKKEEKENIKRIFFSAKF